MVSPVTWLVGAPATDPGIPKPRQIIRGAILLDRSVSPPRAAKDALRSLLKLSVVTMMDVANKIDYDTATKTLSPPRLDVEGYQNGEQWKALLLTSWLQRHNK